MTGKCQELLYLTHDLSNPTIIMGRIFTLSQQPRGARYGNEISDLLKNHDTILETLQDTDLVFYATSLMRKSMLLLDLEKRCELTKQASDISEKEQTTGFIPAMIYGIQSFNARQMGQCPHAIDLIDTAIKSAQAEDIPKIVGWSWILKSQIENDRG